MPWQACLNLRGNHLYVAMAWFAQPLTFCTRNLAWQMAGKEVCTYVKHAKDTQLCVEKCKSSHSSMQRAFVSRRQTEDVMVEEKKEEAEQVEAVSGDGQRNKKKVEKRHQNVSGRSKRDERYQKRKEKKGRKRNSQEDTMQTDTQESTRKRKKKIRSCAYAERGIQYPIPCRNSKESNVHDGLSWSKGFLEGSHIQVASLRFVSGRLIFFQSFQFSVRLVTCRMLLSNLLEDSRLVYSSLHQPVLSCLGSNILFCEALNKKNKRGCACAR